MLVKDRVWKILYITLWGIFTMAAMLINARGASLGYQILIFLGVFINLKFLVGIVKDYIDAKEA